MRSRVQARRPWSSAALVLAVLCPRIAVADGPSDLRDRADALEAEGHHADAAALWDQLAREADDDRARMHGYMHAFHAWMAAYTATADADHLRAAKATLELALGDERIDARARVEFEAELDKLKALGVDEVARVALLDPDGEPPAYEPRREPTQLDRPRRSPLTIAGASTLALAAPALGGFVYAVLRDQAIAREANKQREMLAAGGEVDGTTLPERRAEAVVIRNLEIGLGVTSSILVATGVALLIAGRRSRGATSISILPHAGRGVGGVALTGRF